MKSDCVLVRAITQCGDHEHLRFRCPDCLEVRDEDSEHDLIRYECPKTGREFLVVGVRLKTKRSTQNSLFRRHKLVWSGGFCLPAINYFNVHLACGARINGVGDEDALNPTE